MSHQSGQPPVYVPPHNVRGPENHGNTSCTGWNRFPLSNNNSIYHNPLTPDQTPPLFDNRFPFPSYPRLPLVDNRLPSPAEQRLPCWSAPFDQRPTFPVNQLSSFDQRPPLTNQFPNMQRATTFKDNLSPSSSGQRPPYMENMSVCPRQGPPLEGNNNFQSKQRSHMSHGAWETFQGRRLEHQRKFNTGSPSALSQHVSTHKPEEFALSPDMKSGRDNSSQNSSSTNSGFVLFNTSSVCQPFPNIQLRPPKPLAPVPPFINNIVPPVNESGVQKASASKGVIQSAMVQKDLIIAPSILPHLVPQNAVGVQFTQTNLLASPQVNIVSNQNSPLQTPFLSCPPSLPSTSNHVVYRDMKKEYRETMIDIVKIWTESRSSFEASKSGGQEQQVMKLHKYRTQLKSFVGLIEKLRSLNDSLAEHMEAETSVWDELIQNVTKTKSEVVTLQYQLFNANQLNFIAKEQKDRKRKRDRIRRKKKVQREQYLSSLRVRIKLNEDIDEAMQKQHTTIAMERMVESLKNEAGESLVEVKHKQKEVSEFIKVFTLLKELRDIRKKTAIYKGIFVTEKDDDKFSGHLNKVSNLLSHQFKVCESEERALRVLREEEAEEMNRLEKEKRKKRKQNRQDQLSTVDPMFPFRLYWLQGEESIAGLIHVRTMWDIFLSQPDTPGGTRIPKNFVEPNATPNREWSKYLVKQTKVRKRKSDIGVLK